MDPIADMITIIRNGYASNKRSVSVRKSKIKENVAKKLVDLKFLEGIEPEKEKRRIKLNLLYRDEAPAIIGIERVSKPSLRRYSKYVELKPILGGLGEVILSTPKGVVSGREAKRMKSGGEVLLKVW
jgi:small subunit ribosomal protein S8